MKLMIINVRDEDKDKVMKRLIENNFTPTHIASTGEFLHFGKSIFMLGLEGERVDEASKIIAECTNSNQMKEDNKLKAEWYLINTQMLQK